MFLTFHNRQLIAAVIFGVICVTLNPMIVKSMLLSQRQQANYQYQFGISPCFDIDLKLPT